MFEFIDAFNQGVKAAKNINKYQAEIDSVFTELAESVKRATNGLFTIVRNNSLLSQAAAAMDSISGVAPTSQVKASGSLYLCAVSDSSKKVRIADWVQQPKGFTFVLLFEYREIISKNKIELSGALKELLSSPVVGKAFLNLTDAINREAHKAEESAGSQEIGGGRTAFKPQPVAAKSPRAAVAARAAAYGVLKPSSKKTKADAVKKPVARSRKTSDGPDLAP